MNIATVALGVGLRIALARRIADSSGSRSRARRTSAIQSAQLRWLLSFAQHTEYARSHEFARLADVPDPSLVEAFGAAVPVNTYDTLLPLLRRMREQAEPDITWPGVVRDWAQTSGTTAGDKYVPVSRELLQHNKRASMELFASAAAFGASLPSIFAGKLLFLGGSTDLATSPHGIRTGDLSGIATQLIKWPVTSVCLPPKDIALMSRWPEKIEAMARACMREDVRWIGGMPSWTIVLAERMLELARREGRRAACLRDLWPNLQVFVHGGVKYTPFEARIREIWSGSPEGDDIPTRVEIYAASEGLIAVQDRRGDPGLRLLVDHRIFYEFVPLEEINSPYPRCFTCDRVEKGQRYVVVMTTCGGLWRYVIGDVVEFDTIPPDGPPRLRIVGRHRHFINAFGENLIVEHIENAVVAAGRATGARVGEFTAGPIYPDAGAGSRRRQAGLEVAIEWEGDRSALSSFARVLDESLKGQNADYTTKRTDGLAMAPPTITPIPFGTFHRWLDSRGKLGGQHKCPRCANHRDIIESVLALAPNFSSEHLTVVRPMEERITL